MAEFASVERRFAGSEGERAMLHSVRARLPGGTIGRIEPFVAHTAPALVAAMHDLVLLVGGVIGLWKPWIGLLLSGIVTLSLLAEGSGRVSLIRWGMPLQASYNFVVRRKAATPLGTLVISAPLDAPPVQPMDWPWLRHQRPMRVTFAAAVVVTAMLALRTLAEPWGPRTFELYVTALVVLAVGMLFGIVAHRRPGKGQDDGSGPAVVLELMRRLVDDPIPGVEVWFAFTGCGRSYQGGMDSFLTLHRRSMLDPLLVIALDDPGHVPLRAVVSEGPLFAQAHRPTGPALVERLRWAGVVVPPSDFPGATDARAALVRKVRAVALRGGDGPSSAEAAVRAVDVLETMGRWFGDDLARVAVNRPALEGLARATFDSDTTDEEDRPPPPVQSSEPTP